MILAGSLRDDGPLPDTITRYDEPEAYSQQLQNADIVLVPWHLLHGIASGNMLPARIPMICVDINAAVVTKLSDRGTAKLQYSYRCRIVFKSIVSEIKI